MIYWLSPLAIVPLVCVGASLISYMVIRQIALPVLSMRLLAPFALISLTSAAYSFFCAMYYTATVPWAQQLLLSLRGVVLVLFCIGLMTIHFRLFRRRSFSALRLRLQIGISMLIASCAGVSALMVAAVQPDLTVISVFNTYRLVVADVYHPWGFLVWFTAAAFAYCMWLVALQPANLIPRKTLFGALLVGIVLLATSRLQELYGIGYPNWIELGVLTVLIGHQRALVHQLVAQYRTEQKYNQLRQSVMSNLSHDLRTPLGVVSGYTDMIRKSKLGPVTEAQLKALNTSMENLQQETELIDDLLLSARIDVGVELKLGQLMVDDIVRSILAQQQDKEIASPYTVDFQSLPTSLVSDKHLIKKMMEKVISAVFVVCEPGSRIEIVVEPTAQADARIKISALPKDSTQTNELPGTRSMPLGLPALFAEDNIGRGHLTSFVLAQELASKLGARIELQSNRIPPSLHIRIPNKVNQ